MASYDYGKEEVVRWATEHFKQYSKCLDVGACDGKWYNLLGKYFNMYAVEVFEPNIVNHKLREKYQKVYACNIVDFRYSWYDLIIFGDVIEHLTVKDAQCVLKYASTRCKDMIIGVPFLYKQDAIYGNPYERHIQDDLTRELFEKRYPGFELILQPVDDYAYYHKKL